MLLAVLDDADDAGCAFTVGGVHGFHARILQVTGLAEVLAVRHEFADGGYPGCSAEPGRGTAE
jgi:hypothetical protein